MWFVDNMTLAGRGNHNACFSFAFMDSDEKIYGINKNDDTLNIFNIITLN
jgi:hypothetical protein